MAAFTVLHYTGYVDDRGGIVSVVRALAGAGWFECVLGMNRGGVQRRREPLAMLELPAMAGETISLGEIWRARAVAREVRSWLRVDGRRVFHGHSRAGLLVALWLQVMGEQRAVVSVHCYGRQRWFYRWAARRMAGRLYWLSPAMKRYYGIADPGKTWSQCIPACVPAIDAGARKIRSTDPRGRLRLAGVGTLVPRKRWDLVLDALDLLSRDERGRVSFRHVGAEDLSASSKTYATVLRARTGTTELAGCVQWLGARPSSAELLGESDLLVVPSHREPFPVAALEALSAGIPVLAANTGGLQDVIEPGANGWFFEDGDASDLAANVRRLLAQTAWTDVRVDASALVRFTAPVVAQAWNAAYERASGVGPV